MREILFRGKRKDGLNEWLEGCLSLYSDPGVVEIEYPITLEDEDFNTYESCDWAEVDPETVGQYVGFTDMKGNKIFEGDILEGSVKRTGHKYGNLILVTDIRECKFIALYAPEYTIIGNVWDNPELVEERDYARNSI